MTQSIELNRELKTILTPAFERKVQSIKALDVSQLTSYTDTLVIITGRAPRQVSAIAEHVYSSLKKQGMKAIGAEGMKEGQWALLDFGHVILHIFDSETGQTYDLEGLWSDAPSYDLSELETLYPLEGDQ
ncbi:MAG: ribosome silencing factor [Desulfobacteraceae bacterium]|nr:MAG: ribosome silencing factor [Desulfobacteraceae bacterium]